MRTKLIITAIILVLIVIIDVLFGITHGDDWWAEIPAFFAILAIFGCGGIIILAKILGDKLLKRKEDYYDSE